MLVPSGPFDALHALSRDYLCETRLGYETSLTWEVLTVEGLPYGVSYACDYSLQGWATNMFLGLVFVLYLVWFSSWWMTKSRWLSWHMLFSEQPRIRGNTVRSLFMRLSSVQSPGLPGQHTHPGSARVRNDSADTAYDFARSIGMRPYFVQRSSSDVRHGRAGCRTYYWAKDLSVEHEELSPEDDDLMVLVDVDMYLDMPALLQRGLPVLISTFQPSVVAKGDGDYSFTFDADSVVHYKVSGGAEFTHKVWNYSGDSLIVTQRSWYGRRVCVAYSLDRRQIDDNHQQVLLTPMTRIVSWFNEPARFITGNELKRLRVNVGHSNVLQRMTPSGLYRSVGRPMSYACADVSAAMDDTVASVARLSKLDLTVAQVRTVTGETSQDAASALTEYHRAKDSVVCPTVYPLDMSVSHYQFLMPDYDVEAKPAVVPFMSPLIDECFAPVKSRGNDGAAVAGRVLEVAPSQLPITPFLSKCVQEFIELLIPTPGQGHPVDQELVYDKQSRPTQRRNLDSAAVYTCLTEDSVLETFQKAETYQKVSDPRIITTIPSSTKNHYSQYIYSFTEVLRATKWYAFAKTPVEVAQRVSKVCSDADHVVLTDLSRFDGRVSNILRHVEQCAVIRYFNRAYHGDLLELVASQQNRRAKTKFGVRYSTGQARASGSPETADFNSLDNAFMAYCALRKTVDKRTGSVFTACGAWNKLGIYGGDDGITPDVDEKIYVKICASVGQLLEISTIHRGMPGVSMLSRYYSPDVWHGALDSMCDLRRQLAKLHVTGHLSSGVTPLQKLGEKVLGLSMTDRNTPIVGVLVEAFIALHPSHVPKQLGLGEMRGVASYQAYGPSDEQYPNDNVGEWMWDIYHSTMPEFDYAVFNNWIEQVLDGEASILSPPMCEPERPVVAVKRPCVVRDELIVPAPSVKDVKYCNDYDAGKCDRRVCKFVHRDVPAPRLVGIELNPGPEGLEILAAACTAARTPVQPEVPSRMENSGVATRVAQTPLYPYPLSIELLFVNAYAFHYNMKRVNPRMIPADQRAEFDEACRDLAAPLARVSNMARYFQARQLVSLNDVPAPRLVGIEPNPGPPSAAMKQLTAAAAALGSAMATKKKKKNKNKNKNKNRVGRLQAPVTTVAELDTPPAPVSQVQRIRLTNRTHNFFAPFDVVTLSIVSNASSQLIFNAMPSQGIVNLDPTITLNGSALFGVPLQQLALNYRQYRFLRLEIEYEPVVSTATAGALTMVYVADGGLSQEVIPSIAAVNQCDGAIMTPVWSRAKVPMFNLERNWLFTKSAAAETTTSDRIEDAGSLVVSSASAAPVNTTVGFVRFRGMIEFKDLSTGFALLTRKFAEPDCVVVQKDEECKKE